MPPMYYRMNSTENLFRSAIAILKDQDTEKDALMALSAIERTAGLAILKKMVTSGINAS